MRIGEYETAELLGQGGMSEVYAATHVRLGSRHAVKIYAYGKESAEVRKRFETEGLLLAKLSHPRIVRVDDVGALPDGRPYFVMDLVLAEDGKPRSLADVGEGSVDEETVGRWYDDIREGLAYIHGKGIVHRDLKLENVLVGPDGHAVLTDFGISRIGAGAEDGERVVDPVATLVRVQDGKRPLMGSIGYMAPELELGVAASPQSDWYALGVIVYRLLTGEWCDARTDVVAALETYDPAWTKILPKLLHANPAGRECLSFADVGRSLERSESIRYEGLLDREVLRRKRLLGGLCAVSALAVLLALCLVAGLSGSPRPEDARVPASPRLEDVFAVGPNDGTPEISNGDMKATAAALRRELFGDMTDLSTEQAIDRLKAVLSEEEYPDDAECNDEAVPLIITNAVRRLGGTFP